MNKTKNRKPKVKSIEELRKDKLDAEFLSPKMKAQLDAISNLHDESQMRLNYAKTLMNPEVYSYRIPDETTLPTVLYRSCREFSIYANMDGTVNAGRFSMAIQPTFGSLSNASQFQVGIVDTTSGWPQSFSSASSYVSTDRGDDPRVDPYIELLTNDASGQWMGTNVDIQSYAVGTNYDGSGFEADILNPTNNLPIYVNPTSSSFAWAFTGFSGNILNGYKYSFPSGTFNLNFVNQVITTVSPIGGGLKIVCISVDSNNVVDGAWIVGAGISFATYGYMANKARYLYSDFAPVSITTEDILALQSINMYADSSHTYVFGIAAVTVNVGIASFRCGWVITATNDPNLDNISNSGLIIKARPVALSALFTCTLSDIAAGGNIVGYSAPSGDVHNYYYSTSQSIGPYQNWEVLARNNKGMCTHDGNIKQGTYVFAQPWDKNDMLFRIPSDLNSYPYQGIIISGQVNPSVGVVLSGIVEIGRLRAIITYEYTTDSRLFDPQPCIGSSLDVDFVLSMLSQVDHAYENNDHLKKLGNFIKKGAKFIGANIPTMIKGLQLASTFL